MTWKEFKDYVDAEIQKAVIAGIVPSVDTDTLIDIEYIDMSYDRPLTIYLDSTGGLDSTVSLDSIGDRVEMSVYN